MIRAVLLDVDGVLAIPEELFSRKYAVSKGWEPQRFHNFFVGEFQQTLLGKLDLKELITRHQALWQWEGDINHLLDQWFQSENVPNKPLLSYVKILRSTVPCYLATNQERYRGEFIKQVMFPGFDGYFISNEMGIKKPDVAFFEKTIQVLQSSIPGILPAEILFLDDTPSHISGAKAAGISAHLYKSPEQAIQLLTPFIQK